MEELVPGSPEWWLKRLDKKLWDRDTNLKRYEDYFSGRHRMAFATSKFREVFGSLFATFADNWCGLVIKAARERLKVEGFRLSGSREDVTKASTGDRETWDIWQRNNLDAESGIAHSEAMINGECSALVWYDENDFPEITLEHPRNMIVESVQGYRWKRKAALKRWKDDDEFLYATIYLPDGIYKYRSAQKSLGELEGWQETRWEKREVDNEEWPLPNPFGVVTVVPLYNEPLLRDLGRSDLADLIPLQDAINKLIADMMVASEFAAFRQRWMAGIEIPTDPQTGEQLPLPWKAGIDRIWMSEDPNSKFGEFSAADLSNYTKAVETLVQHFATQSRTPPHYFYLSGNFPSGETIKSAETPLVAKVRDKMGFFGEGWEEIMRLAHLVKGDTQRANAFATETIWGDPESRSEAQHVDAVLKKQALGVPWEQLMEDLGYSPQQITRFKQMREENPVPQNGQVVASADLG